MRQLKEQRAKVYLGLIILAVFMAGAVFFGLGFHREPRYIWNYESEEYAQDTPFVAPTSVTEGLAVYKAGSGEPLLLFPYPHGHTTEPMAQGELAESLVAMGRMVVTFDVPGAFMSTRKPVGDIAEMLRSADETLSRLGIPGAVDVVGHSMGGLAAVAYAIERPERVKRLILVGSTSGFPAAARWGLPGSAFRMTDLDYWRIVFWGMRVNNGRGNLALHKKLQNLMESTAYFDPRHFDPLEIHPDDAGQGVPIRMTWTQNMYRRLSYADRLSEVRAPALVMVGRHDTYTPLACSEELAEGIPNVELEIFESSGHAPFIEEPERFSQILRGFLGQH